MKRKVFWPNKSCYWLVLPVLSFGVSLVIFYVFRNQLDVDSFTLTLSLFFLFWFLPSVTYMQRIEINSLGIAGPLNGIGFGGRWFIAHSDIEVCPYEKTTSVGLVIRSKKSWEQMIVSKKSFKSSTIEEIKRLLQT